MDPEMKASGGLLLGAGAGYQGPNPGGIYTNPVGHWIFILVGIVILLLIVLTVVANTVWYERVSLGRLQLRYGPNRVGPNGTMQIPADTVTNITKESFAPYGVDRTLYLLAPGLIVTASLLAWAVIPVGFWYGWYYWIANLNVGMLFIFGVAAMNVYAILLAGWSSNNKYSMLGGLRAAAQLVSYEIAMGLSLVPVFMIAHSVTLQSIAT
jgi:NADH-quinone oxidoreductase subunit H